MSLVIAAGGTGGHVFPALAVVQAWRRRWQSPIYWVGVSGGKEEKWVKAEGIPFYGLPMAGWQPRARWRNLSLLYRLPLAYWAVEKLLRRLRPHAVFSTGGYPGLMPGLWAALHHRPLYLLELNSYAGKTIRWLSRWATQTFGAFPKTSGVRAHHVGVPVRFLAEDRLRYTSEEAKRSWGMPSDCPLILIMGGSQGSSALNKAVASCVSTWVRDGACILWQVGRDSPVQSSEQIRVLPFIQDMTRAYIAADIVVSRAGGSTLGELAWWGKAAVLVPSPYVAEDHQRKNAATWAAHGACIVAEEENVNALNQAVLRLLRHPHERQALAQVAHSLARVSAADDLAEYLHRAIYGIP
ncbi:MAG: UDP-N-acetylglucosamine--N-acetylmuramyl-(pentapeptide) pyrophosphoryl-undecaprenol N-acetylglucosamine transferase [Bacteroidia bacterium]|nr:UDP-N-acetylglucosamine--N-acetylmuramyl-(pentapeptide) pyrophosphoryl-undecaprenol N-acetylglucosamine transferase [Bacteroidia bacterium]MCX7652654.1 UDP-N-acetylglucosamine--N-acetylmuramyl-(pentapeptide) pyrophosphoryl-undecaprenol N-acetylglucosamine transferase [Bacteroidia bacterium]MDW8416992.1 UDP-N-acetylglucosamine--N-acetylmuramyl-(pentapeptide) pyrophosphoryl-undecaprenol N-acetylglucosamine transferase [Bacteroidia bacterium]